MCQYKNFIRVTLVFTVYAMLLLNTISIVKSSFKLPLFFFSNVVYFLFYSKLCSLNDEVKWCFFIVVQDPSNYRILFLFDRFAQFFLCPLFNSDATDREVNAVESGL